MKKPYNTNQSYKELVYGKYIFSVKMIAIVVFIVVAAYIILRGIAYSLHESKKMLSVKEFLCLPESERAKFRVSVKSLLIEDVIKYRTDTVLIEIKDPCYFYPTTRGTYRFPEERAIYECRIYSLELLLKRSLFELMYPFVFTITGPADSLIKYNLTNYVKHEGLFPMYITKRIEKEYIVSDTLPNGTTQDRKIYLRDSLAAFFNKELYKENISDRIWAKYVGDGPIGDYKRFSLKDFGELSIEQQKEQRRAFLNLNMIEKNKLRKVNIGVQDLYGGALVDEEPGMYFATLAERKVHECEITNLLAPYFNLASFSLIYPMGRVARAPFSREIGSDNKNTIILIALKSGNAPAQYSLERKDCPKVLKMGMYADITDYITQWEHPELFPKFVMSETSIHGRYYGVPEWCINTDAIAYRRDWLEEPSIYEWFKSKKWIHPIDKRPYIPPYWTFEDFRTIALLITKNDTTGKRRGFVDAPGDFLYLFAHSLFHFPWEHFIKPNRTQKTTWTFFDDNPVLLEGLKTVNQMFWSDRSIFTGVEVSYASAHSDFFGSRVGMLNTTSREVLYNALMQKYSYFGRERSYGDVVGLTSWPGASNFPNITPGDCNIVGFNSYLAPEQLHLSVEWMKELFNGESFNNDLFFKVKESRILGSECLIFREALSSVYKVDTKKLNIDYYSVFPANYIEFYDYVKSYQYLDPPPKMEDFGLTTPEVRALQEEVFKNMFQQVILDSLPNYRQIIRATMNHCNAAILGYKDNDLVDNYRNYYNAMLAYYRKNVPAYYPIFKERYEKYFKFW